LMSKPSSSHRRVSSWMQWWELDVHLTPGDLVEFSSVSHIHWAVFEQTFNGEAYVIHYWNEDDEEETQSSRNPRIFGSICEIIGDVQVRRDTLAAVAKGCLCRINNKLDMQHTSFTPEEIVSRARGQIGNATRYHLMYNNCEHFANWCRYGEEKSQQV
ncbi:hypothetical protein PFISCL1PPCAC_8554, partial [Pristionchus fissidentatus]